MAQYKTIVRLPVAPKALYKAWLSGREHAAMTGAKAKASPRKGGRFTAWDGWVSGKNLKLKPHWCIVQSWRTSEFPKGAQGHADRALHPSCREDRLETRLHPFQARAEDRSDSIVPAGARYYWAPMKKYFAKKRRKAR